MILSAHGIYGPKLFPGSSIVSFSLPRFFPQCTCTGYEMQPGIARREKGESMRQDHATTHRISRRTFLKGSAGAAAAGSLMGLTACSPSTAATDEDASMADTSAGVVEDNDQIFSGVCRGNCYGGCFLNVHVRDGKVVRTSARDLPDTRWNRICAKGLSHVFRVYDENRIKYPMRRVEGTERGAGEWEKLSWDEALDYIAEKLKGYADEFGPESIGYVYGAGNDAFVNNNTRFFNYIGASNLNYPLDMACFFAFSKTFGVGMNFSNNEMTDLVNSKVIVLWGSNPAVSQMQGMHFFTEARDSGAKLICIDPVYSSSAAKCDQWIPIAPATDGLLAMALMTIIIENGWTDEAFMKQKTVAPFLVKESDGKYLRLSDLGQAEAGSDADAIVVTDGSGTFAVPEQIADPVIEGTFEANGVKVTCAYTLLQERLAQYPVDEAVETCGVSREVMEQLAQDLSINGPTNIYMMLGMDHYKTGAYNMFDACCIPALTGNIGKPGAGCGISESLFYFFDNPEAKYGAACEGAVGTKFSLPMWQLNEIMDAGEYLGEPITMKAMWIIRRDILGNFVDRTYTKEMMDRLDFIITSDIVMNEQARYSDVVLPVCHWFEQEEVGATYPQNPYLEYQEKCIDPLFESKSDFDIFKELAAKMGFGDKFDFTPGDFIADKFDDELCRSLGVTYEALVEQKAVRGLPGSAEAPFVHGGDGVFPTPTGRVQFYDEAPAVNVFYGQNPDFSHDTLPYWEPPSEAPVPGFVNEKYPYQLLSERQKLRTHTQWNRIEAVLELDSEPTVKLHESTAAERNVAEGDYVRIFNDRGSVVMRAHLHNGVRPGVLLCSRGWDAEQYVEGNFQDLLTRDMSEICVNQAFFDNAGDFEKVEV